MRQPLPEKQGTRGAGPYGRGSTFVFAAELTDFPFLANQVLSITYEALPQKLRKNHPQADLAGETACPTIAGKGLMSVAQAVSPACRDGGSVPILLSRARKQAVPVPNL